MGSRVYSAKLGVDEAAAGESSFPGLLFHPQPSDTTFLYRYGGPCTIGPGGCLLVPPLTCLLASKVCVRRRAILSVAANPNCKSKEEAERVVNEVWESCSNDTRPFDEVQLLVAPQT